MLRDFVLQILANITSKNEIFGNNAFVYETEIERQKSGISDRYANQIYFKLEPTDEKEYDLELISYPSLYRVSADYIIIAQIQKDIDISQAGQSLLNQLVEIDGVIPQSYSTDNEAIKKKEDAKGSVRDFNLVCIRANVWQDMNLDTCATDSICFPSQRVVVNG